MKEKTERWVKTKIMGRKISAQIFSPYSANILKMMSAYYDLLSIVKANTLNRGTVFSEPPSCPCSLEN